MVKLVDTQCSERCRSNPVGVQIPLWAHHNKEVAWLSWLERRVHIAEVSGSNPLATTNTPLFVTSWLLLASKYIGENYNLFNK